MNIARRRNHVFAVSPVPPLSANEKLAVVNKFHQQKKKPPVSSIPPSQIVLTPVQTIQGGSYVGGVGYWDPKLGAVTVSGSVSSSCYVQFNFVGLASGTY